MSKQRYSIYGLLLGIICVVSLLAMPSMRAWAALQEPQPPSHVKVLALPTRPARVKPKLPPRPPTVTVSPEPTVSALDSAAIALNVEFIPGSPLEKQWREDLWTMVQWQDHLGHWHTVDGWQASLDEVKGDSGRKIWYVSKDLFGRGPFCWVVRPGPEGDPIAVSLPFLMPDSAGVIVQADVELGEPVPLPTAETASESMAPVTGAGERRYTGLQASLTIILIVLLLGSLLFKGWRRRIE